MLINFCINHNIFEHWPIQNLFETNPLCRAAADPREAGSRAPCACSALPGCGTGAVGTENPGGPAVPPARDAAAPHPAAPGGIPRLGCGSQREAGGTEPQPREPLVLRKGLKIRFNRLLHPVKALNSCLEFRF